MKQVDLALGILDHQLIESEGRRCCNVDDLELEDVRGDRPRVAAILTGPGAWRGRGRIGRLAAWPTRGRTARVPWEEVDRVDAHVILKRTAHELGLDRSEERARRLVEKLPGSSL